MKLQDVKSGTKLSDLTTTGGKSKKGYDALAEVRKTLNAVKTRVKGNPTAVAQEFLEGVKNELEPVIIEVAEQVADLLGTEDLNFLREHYDKLVQAASQLIAETSVKSSLAGQNLAFTYLNRAWDLAPKTSQSVAYLVADALQLGICELMDKKDKRGFILSFRDRETGRIRGENVRFTMNTSFSATLREMKEVQESWWADKNAQQKEAEQSIWNSASTTDLISALQSETPVKVAFRVPRNGPEGGCRVALCEVSGGYVKPLDAIGDRAAWFFKKGREQGILLPLESLTKDRLHLPEKLEMNSWKTATNLHRLLRRAVEEAKKKARMMAMVTEFRSHDTLTLEEWFDSDKSGTCTLSERSWFYQDRLSKEKVTLHNVHIRLRREKDGSIFVDEYCDMGDGRDFVAIDNRVQQATPQDQVIYPLSAFLKKAMGRWTTRQERIADANGKNQADERQAEAEAELEAHRQAVALAEANRIATQDVQTK